jgi:hypothetical protein
MSLLEKVMGLFSTRNRALEQKIEHIEGQTSEIKGELSQLADRSDPFAALIRTMRQEAIRRRSNGNGH